MSKKKQHVWNKKSNKMISSKFLKPREEAAKDKKTSDLSKGSLKMNLRQQIKKAIKE